MGERLVVTADRVVPRHGAPPVEALLVEDGVVREVGTREQFQGHESFRYFEGSVVLPSFIDPHQHAYLVTADPHSDSLLAFDSALADLLAAVRRFIEREPTGDSWLRYHGYRPLHLDILRSPTAAELDSVCPDRPLHLISRTYHESVVNSAGLAALGITPATPDPAGGRIVRDRRGRATGVLLETASFLAEAASRTQMDTSVWVERVMSYGRLLASMGITRIGDGAVPADAADTLSAGLDHVGIDLHPLLVGEQIDQPVLMPGMTAKVLADGGEYCHLCFTGRQMGRVMRNGVRAGLGPDRALATAVGRRTGRPRRGARGTWHTGIRITNDSGLDALMGKASEIGAGLAVHAIGNGAVQSVLDAIDAIPGAAADVPLRVEHAMVLDPDLSGRLADSGAHIVVQPGLLHEFGVELTRSPVPDPLRLIPLRTLTDAGASIALSSDFPATDLNPWRAITDAVLRLDSRGDPVHPEETLTLEEALTAHTTGAAAALGVPGGSLEPGSPADFIVVDKDPYALAPQDLMSITTLATFRAGAQTYSHT